MFELSAEGEPKTRKGKGEPELFLVLHLMIAGRLHWHAAGAKPPAKTALAVLEDLVTRLPDGTIDLSFANMTDALPQVEAMVQEEAVRLGVGVVMHPVQQALLVPVQAAEAVTRPAAQTSCGSSASTYLYAPVFGSTLRSTPTTV